MVDQLPATDFPGHSPFRFTAASGVVSRLAPIDSISLTRLLALVAFIALAFYASRTDRRSKSFLCGPPTLPLIGDVPQMPSHDAQLRLEAWARRYGPICSLILGTKTLIVPTSDVAIKDGVHLRVQLVNSRVLIMLAKSKVNGSTTAQMVSRSFPSRVRPALVPVC